MRKPIRVGQSRRMKWYNDPRSKKFSHYRFFGGITSFATSLGRKRLNIENQKDTLRCTGYGAAKNGHYINNRRMHPDWQAAQVGKIQGRSVDVNGGDPNATMKSQRDKGYLPIDSTPITLENNTIENTGMDSFPAVLDSIAAEFKQPGFVKVDGPLDTFDNVRSALSLAYDSKTGLGACVEAFGPWYYEWTFAPKGIIPSEYQVFDGRHHWIFIDWEYINDVPFLICHNSCGESIGDSGFFYFSREVVNREFALGRGTSLKIMKALTPEQIAIGRQEDIYGWIQRMINACWFAISEKFGRFSI